jgi:hypothetical protein
MKIRREIVLGGAGPPDTKANRKLRNIKSLRGSPDTDINISRVEFRQNVSTRSVW